VTTALLRDRNIFGVPGTSPGCPLTPPDAVTSLGLEDCRVILPPDGWLTVQRGTQKTGSKAGWRVAAGSFRHILSICVAGRRQAASVANVAVAAVVIAAGALGVAGCATAPSGGAPGKGAAEAERVAVVTKRAEERWALLIKGDLKAAYGYLSPASRAVITLERYETKTKTGNFREIKMDRVSCDAEMCKVRLYLTYDHRVMQGIVTPLEETWVFESGQAWFVYRE
jgi:hypothetical protein